MQRWRFMTVIAPIRAASLFLGALLGVAACEASPQSSASPTEGRDSEADVERPDAASAHDLTTQDAGLGMEVQRDPCIAQPNLCGPCRFRDMPGTAVIEEISKPSEGDYSCSNSPVRVTVVFIPDAPADGGVDGMARGRYTVDSGANPPESCLEPNGIEVGARFPATRKDSIAGTCAPVLLDVQLPAEEICLQQCWTNEGK